jgi:hypothetical protein
LLNDFCAEPLFLFPKLTFLESDDEPLAIVCIFVNKYTIMLIPKKNKLPKSLTESKKVLNFVMSLKLIGNERHSVFKFKKRFDGLK